MENQIECKSNLTPEMKPSDLDHFDWITDQLSIIACAKGQVYNPERLRINASDLLDISRDRLAAAFAKARRELDYLAQVSEIRRLALMDAASQSDGEMRAAWDVLMAFVEKCVGNDVFGNFGPEHGWYPKSFPTLPARILDTVRRTGGWKSYRCMTDGDFPFVQKRFFEEYRAWTATSLQLPALAEGFKAIETRDAPSLTDGESVRIAEQSPPAKLSPRTKTFCAQSVDYTERREELKRQADELKSKAVQA
jgi:hypothetical protein